MQIELIWVHTYHFVPDILTTLPSFSTAKTLESRESTSSHSSTPPPAHISISSRFANCPTYSVDRDLHTQCLYLLVSFNLACYPRLATTSHSCRGCLLRSADSRCGLPIIDLPQKQNRLTCPVFLCVHTMGMSLVCQIGEGRALRIYPVYLSNDVTDTL
jgi:hypothetical protein